MNNKPKILNVIDTYPIDLNDFFQIENEIRGLYKQILNDENNTKKPDHYCQILDLINYFSEELSFIYQIVSFDKENTSCDYNVFSTVVIQHLHSHIIFLQEMNIFLTQLN